MDGCFFVGGEGCFSTVIIYTHVSVETGQIPVVMVWTRMGQWAKGQKSGIETKGRKDGRKEGRRGLISVIGSFPTEHMLDDSCRN